MSEPSITEPTRLKRRTHAWLRWLHVYTSMISLIIVLFFGLTGITLNHPSWTFGEETARTVETGTLPPASLGEGEGEVEFLLVSEFIRTNHGVRGDVDDFGVQGGEGTISYVAPAYSADLFFDVDSGTYELVVDEEGFVAAMNDLHKGRNSGSMWKWVIDIAAGLLVLIALTGLGIQLFLRKRRTSALSIAAGGAVLTTVLVVVTLF